MQFKPLNVPEKQYQQLDTLRFQLMEVINNPRYQQTGNDKQAYFEMMDAVHQTITKYPNNILIACNGFQTNLYNVYQFQHTPHDGYVQVMLLNQNISQMLQTYDRKLKDQHQKDEQ